MLNRRKILSILLVLAMLLSAMPVFANTDQNSRDFGTNCKLTRNGTQLIVSKSDRSSGAAFDAQSFNSALDEISDSVLTDYTEVAFIDEITANGSLSQLFRNWSNLEIVIMTGFDTSAVSDMSMMFAGCSELTTIIVDSAFSTESVTYSTNMFQGCSSLVGGAGTCWDSGAIDASAACIDTMDGTGWGSGIGYFTETSINSTVNFDTQGIGVAPDAQTVITMTKASCPAEPKVGGYNFVGWYKEDSCENLWDFDTDIVTHNITLYAEWLWGHFEARYRDGKAAPWSYGSFDDAISAAETASKGPFIIQLTNDVETLDEIELNCPKPVILDLDGNVLNLKGNTLTLSCDLTLNDSNTNHCEYYFDESGTIWEQDENGDKLVEGGVIISGPDAICISNSGNMVMNGGNIIGNQIAVSFSGGTFTMNGGSIMGNEYGIVDSSAGGTFTMNGGSMEDNVSITPNTNIYIKATLVSNDGTDETKTLDVQYGEDMPAVEALSREGYEFIGYSDAKTGGTQYYNADGSSARIYDKYSAVTLYGQWKPLNVQYRNSENDPWIIDTFTDVWGTASEITLICDTTINEDLECNNTMVLDLNGYVLDLNGNRIVINESGNLTLNDSNTGNQSHNFSVGSSQMWIPDANGEHTVVGGILISGSTHEDLTTALDNYGSLKMNGGNIVGNYNGIVNEGYFEMNGGNIAGNDDGLDSDMGYSVMNGGNIKFNGEGVIVTIGKNFKMNGGCVSDNTFGVWNCGFFDMNGGCVSDNNFGVWNAGSFDMNSGSVERNGIGVANSGNFTINGGSIADNTVNGVRNYSAFTINGGSIEDTILNKDHADTAEGDPYQKTTCTPHVYTRVTLDPNGGSGGSEYIHAENGVAMPALTEDKLPGREGLCFTGYFDAAAGGIKYYNADGSSAKDFDKTAPITLYAQWKTVLTGTVRISGNPVYGQTLTAAVTGSNNSGQLSYQWLRDGAVITGAASQSYIIGSTENIDPGHQISCRVSSTEEDGFIVSAAVTALKNTISKPVKDSAVFVYNGSEQIYTLTENAAYTISGDKRTDVGSQTVTVSLNDKINYQWADGGSEDLSFAFEINKATPGGAPEYTAITEAEKTLADAALAIGSITPAGGALAWDLPETTTVAANTAYAWTYTPIDTDNYNTLTGSVVLYSVSTGGGGGGNIDAKPADAVVVDGSENTLKVSDAEVVIDKTAMDAILSQAEGKEITLNIKEQSVSDLNGAQKTAHGKLKNAVIIEASFVVDGETISDFGGGTVSFTVPYTLPKGKGAKEVRAYYLSPKGFLVPVVSYYDLASGKLTIEAHHFSSYVISADGDPCEGFSDVNQGAWYHNAVDFALVNGLMSGYANGDFGPNDLLRRDMLVTILWKAAGEKLADAELPFNDVFVDDWYAEPVRWAAATGVASGYSNGEFGPQNALTREQLAVMLYNYEKKINGGGFEGDWMFKLDFSDAGQISAWADEAMHWCVMEGVISGKGGGRLDPKGTATRAEAAQMLMNYLGK